MEAYYNLVMYYQDNDRPAKAIQEYKHIIEKLDSSYIYAYYNMGYIYLVYFQDYDEAIKYFDKVISLDHLYVEAYCNKGVCYEMLGKYKEAYIEFQTACQIHPNFELAIDGLNRIDKKTKTPIQ
ncbi:MAG: tetratricopeptide repeat protein [Bacteroidota bacterium]